MKLFQRVAIVGSGAVGIYYGVRLALGGADVRFLLRSDLEAVRARGSLSVRDKAEEWKLSPVAVFGETTAIGPVDLVVVGLKTTANSALSSLMRPLLDHQTAVLTLQNGLGSDEELAEIVGAERVIGGLAFIALNRTGPGEVWCYHHGSLTVGEFGRSSTSRAEALAAQFRAAGVKVDVASDLASARWHKLVWNIPFNGLAIVGSVTTDRICADPASAARVRVLMKEVQAGAAKLGHQVADDFLRRQFDVTPPMGEYRPSSLVDFLAGRDVEIESIWGEPLRRAQAAGAEMPELARLYEELKAALRGR